MEHRHAKDHTHVCCGDCVAVIPQRPKATPDPVNHPAHYTSHPSGVECIEITKHHDFCIGNAIKYLWRAGLKHEEGKNDQDKEIEDLQKALFYIKSKIEMLEAQKQ